MDIFTHLDVVPGVRFNKSLALLALHWVAVPLPMFPHRNVAIVPGVQISRSQATTCSTITHLANAYKLLRHRSTVSALVKGPLLPEKPAPECLPLNGSWSNQLRRAIVVYQGSTHKNGIFRLLRHLSKVLRDAEK